MRWIKSLVSAGLTLGLVSCQPALALPVPVNNVKVTTTACQYADARMVDVIQLIRDGRSNLEIMLWLDRMTPSPDLQPMPYLGMAMIKLNVPSIRASLNKAYRSKALRDAQYSNCLHLVNKTVPIY